MFNFLNFIKIISFVINHLNQKKQNNIENFNYFKISFKINNFFKIKTELN
jgi:hypothetical protein